MKILFKKSDTKRMIAAREQLYKEAITFGLKELNITKNVIKNRTLHITFKDCDVMSKGSQLAGYFTLEVYHQTTFQIVIKMPTLFVSDNSVLLTIWHEMTHMKQAATGTMRHTGIASNLIFWNNKVVDANKVKYKKLPWEIEANEEAARIMKKWKSSETKTYKNSWQRFFLMMSRVMKID